MIFHVKNKLTNLSIILRCMNLIILAVVKHNFSENNSLLTSSLILSFVLRQ